MLLRIRDSFVFSQHLFFPFAGIILLGTTVYRVGVYAMITARYREFAGLSFGAYAAVAVPADAPVLFISLLVLTAALLLMGETEKARFAAAAAITWVCLAAYLLGLEFFRVYEAPFSGAFLGGENFAGPLELLVSAAAEISFRFILWFLFFSAAIIIFTWYLYRKDRGFYYDGNTIGLFFRGLTIAYLIFMAPLAVLAAAPFSTGGSGARNGGGGAPDRLGELTANPLSGLFHGRSGGHIDGHLIMAKDANRDDDEGPFSDASLESDRVLAPLRVIPRGKRYNIVLYIFESFPSQYLSLEVSGRPVAGNWRRLRKNSIVGEGHYAQNPLSANSLLSILGGVHEPYGRGLIIRDAPNMPLRTLPEILKKQGYRTIHIHTGGLAYAGQDRFLRHRGYDAVLDYFDLKKMSPEYRTVGWGIDERAMIGPALSFMKSGEGTPFFAVFQPVNPHHPYAIPDSSYNIAGPVPLGAPEWKKSWHKYLNSLHYADAVLGMLVDRMEREGLMDNTLFFLVADHGEAFYQHRQNYNHPFFLYEENVRVPFLVYNRKIIRETFFYRGVSRHVDIAPTVLDVLGLPVEPAMHGSSILAGGREKMAFLHTSWKDDYRAVRDGMWKYILRTKDSSEELYNLETDPGEAVNLAAANPKICGRYRSAISRSMKFREEYYGDLLSGNASRLRANFR